MPAGTASKKERSREMHSRLFEIRLRCAFVRLHSKRKMLGVTSVKSRRPAVKRRRSSGAADDQRRHRMGRVPADAQVLKIAVVGRDEDDACFIVPGRQQPSQDLIEGRQETQGGGHILPVSGIIAQPVFEEGEIIAG